MHDNQTITLVLLPGLDGTGRLFKPLLDAFPLSVRVQVIVYPPDQLQSLNEYAEFVKDRLPPGRIVLLAESFSGPVALTLLQALDKAVETVIFCASFAEPPRPFLLRLAPLVAHSGLLLRSMPDFLLQRFCLGPDSTIEQLTLVKETLAAVPPEVLARRLELIADSQPFLQTRFEIPCYFFRATDDRLVPAKSVNWFKSHFEPFRLEHLAAPHFLLQTKPQECAQLISKILNIRAEHRRGNTL